MFSLYSASGRLLSIFLFLSSNVKSQTTDIPIIDSTVSPSAGNLAVSPSPDPGIGIGVMARAPPECSESEFYSPFVTIRKKKNGANIAHLDSTGFLDVSRRVGVILCVNGPAILLENYDETPDKVGTYSGGKMQVYVHECFMVNQVAPTELQEIKKENDGEIRITSAVNVNGRKVAGVHLVGVAVDYRKPEKQWFRQQNQGHQIHPHKIVSDGSFAIISNEEQYCLYLNNEFFVSLYSMSPSPSTVCTWTVTPDAYFWRYEAIFRSGRTYSEYHWEICPKYEIPTTAAPGPPVPPPPPRNATNLDPFSIIVEPPKGQRPTRPTPSPFPINPSSEKPDILLQYIVEFTQCLPLPERDNTSCPLPSNSTGDPAQELIMNAMFLDDENNNFTLAKDFGLHWKDEILDLIAEIFGRICEPFPPYMAYIANRILEYYLVKAHEADKLLADPILERGRNFAWKSLLSDLKICRRNTKHPMGFWWEYEIDPPEDEEEIEDDMKKKQMLEKHMMDIKLKEANTKKKKERRGKRNAEKVSENEEFSDYNDFNTAVENPLGLWDSEGEENNINIEDMIFRRKRSSSPTKITHWASPLPEESLESSEESLESGEEKRVFPAEILSLGDDDEIELILMGKKYKQENEAVWWPEGPPREEFYGRNVSKRQDWESLDDYSDINLRSRKQGPNPTTPDPNPNPSSPDPSLSGTPDPSNPISIRGVLSGLDFSVINQEYIQKAKYGRGDRYKYNFYDYPLDVHHVDRNDQKSTPLFYYTDDAEVDYELNIGIDIVFKIWAAVAGYCGKHYRQRKSENFARFYMHFYRDFLEPVEDEWMAPEDNDILRHILSEVNSDIGMRWLDTCLEASYVESESTEFRPPRPILVKGRNATLRLKRINEFTNIESKYGSNPTRKKYPDYETQNANFERRYDWKPNNPWDVRGFPEDDYYMPRMTRGKRHRYSIDRVQPSGKKFDFRKAGMSNVNRQTQTKNNKKKNK